MTVDVILFPQFQLQPEDRQTEASPQPHVKETAERNNNEPVRRGRRSGDRHARRLRSAVQRGTYLQPPR